MSKQIFVNLHVKDLQKSMDFFQKLGFTFNPQFTDEKAACMVISDTIFSMLLMEPYFKSFMDKDIPDTKKTSEVFLSLSAESREEVDSLVKKAFDAGARNYKQPQDYGFMYQHAFEDLDGHIWEIFWMDPNGIPQQ
ncbi:MAG TPA: VOC family protein [Bacteroidia bacterium]|nr:VOC family protein [Bacteroidia bacterium]